MRIRVAATARARPQGQGHVPDVLLQPHSAPLGLAFNAGAQFPAAWKGDAFVALHGSWNRTLHTGYKIVRLPFKDGKPTGEYQDFVTGFTVGPENVWGRPVDVAFAQGRLAAVHRRRQRRDLSRLLQGAVGRALWGGGCALKHPRIVDVACGCRSAAARCRRGAPSGCSRHCADRPRRRRRAGFARSSVAGAGRRRCTSVGAHRRRRGGQFSRSARC